MASTELVSGQMSGVQRWSDNVPDHFRVEQWWRLWILQEERE